MLTTPPVCVFGSNNQYYTGSLTQFMSYRRRNNNMDYTDLDDEDASDNDPLLGEEAEVKVKLPTKR